MLPDFPIFVGFMNGASQHTQNIASIVWVIYSSSGQLVSFGNACLGPETKKIVEYSIMI